LLLFLFDAFTDDIADIGRAFFFLFFDKDRVVIRLVRIGGLGSGRSRLLALLLGLGLVQRYKFGVRGLRHDRFRNDRGLRRVRPRTRRDNDRHENCFAFRAHNRRLVQIIELRAAAAAKALGAKIGFCHVGVP
jgi:hypothetical protein